jgi:hypothetical protein
VNCGVAGFSTVSVRELWVAGFSTDSVRELFSLLEGNVEHKVNGIVIYVYNVDGSVVTTF